MPQPPNDHRAIHVWLVLWKAARAIEENALQSIAALGLGGLSDFAVLELLVHAGPQPVNVIGRKILLTSGSITTAVNRLEGRKLVRRTSHPDDRRARLVELTSSGKRLIEVAFRQHEKDLEATLAVLSEQERADLVVLLKKAGRYAAERLLLRK